MYVVGSPAIQHSFSESYWQPVVSTAQVSLAHKNVTRITVCGILLESGPDKRLSNIKVDHLKIGRNRYWTLTFRLESVCGMGLSHLRVASVSIDLTEPWS